MTRRYGISLAIAARGPCDARQFWHRLEAWPPADAHIAFDDETVLAGKPGWVQAHRCQAGSIFDYWGTAIAHCDGDYVAVLSPYLTPGENWRDAMTGAMSSGDRAYFGPVEQACEPHDGDIVGYLVEYGHFHRPLRGDHGEIPGTNIVIRASEMPPREDLLRHGFTKTALLTGWNKDGYRPTYVEDAAVVYRRAYDAAAYRARRFRHGRAYGASCRKRMGLAELALALAKCGLLPLVRVWRIRTRLRHVPALRHAVRHHAGGMLLAETAWSAGEFTGLATGDPGNPDLLD